MVFYTRADIQHMVRECGFGDCTITNLRDYEGLPKSMTTGRSSSRKSPPSVPPPQRNCTLTRQVTVNRAYLA